LTLNVSFIDTLNNPERMKTKILFLAAAALALAQSGRAQSIYNGNGDSGFGGAIGNGVLTLNNDGTTIYGSLTTGSGIGNALVIYIATSPGSFTSTAGFNDAGDQLRSAISGYGGGSEQSVMTFASGFTPSYAIALQPGDSVNFGGLWSLADGGNNSLPYITSVNLTPTGTDAQGTYTFSLPMADLGLSVGQSFELFGTFVSDTGYRSTEAIAGNDSGVQGWNPFTQTGFGTYTIVPEPSTMVLGAAGMATLFLLRRRR
jgi:hypothetical protein